MRISGSDVTAGSDRDACASSVEAGNPGGTLCAEGWPDTALVGTHRWIPPAAGGGDHFVGDDLAPSGCPMVNAATPFACLDVKAPPPTVGPTCSVPCSRSRFYLFSRSEPVAGPGRTDAVGACTTRDAPARALQAGAWENDLHARLVGETSRAADEELVAVHCRRAVFECAFRRALVDEPLVSLTAGQGRSRAGGPNRVKLA